MNDFNDQIIEEFRANGGVTEMFGEAGVLLTTTGAKSGKQRTTPLVYRRSGDRIMIFASKAGADTHPAWFHNLLADPKATIELGRDGEVETLDVNATPLQGEERDREFAAQVEAMPRFAEYQDNTDRVIPVVALTPA